MMRNRSFFCLCLLFFLILSFSVVSADGYIYLDAGSNYLSVGYSSPRLGYEYNYDYYSPVIYVSGSYYSPRSSYSYDYDWGYDYSYSYPSRSYSYPSYSSYSRPSYGYSYPSRSYSYPSYSSYSYSSPRSYSSYSSGGFNNPTYTGRAWY